MHTSTGPLLPPLHSPSRGDQQQQQHQRSVSYQSPSHPAHRRNDSDKLIDAIAQAHALTYSKPESADILHERLRVVDQRAKRVSQSATDTSPRDHQQQHQSITSSNGSTTPHFSFPTLSDLRQISEPEQAAAVRSHHAQINHRRSTTEIPSYNVLSPRSRVTSLATAYNTVYKETVKVKRVPRVALLTPVGSVKSPRKPSKRLTIAPSTEDLQNSIMGCNQSTAVPQTAEHGKTLQEDAPSPTTVITVAPAPATIKSAPRTLTPPQHHVQASLTPLDTDQLIDLTQHDDDQADDQNLSYTATISSDRQPVSSHDAVSRTQTPPQAITRITVEAPTPNSPPGSTQKPALTSIQSLRNSVSSKKADSQVQSPSPSRSLRQHQQANPSVTKTHVPKKLSVSVAQTANHNLNAKSSDSSGSSFLKSVKNAFSLQTPPSKLKDSTKQRTPHQRKSSSVEAVQYDELCIRCYNCEDSAVAYSCEQCKPDDGHSLPLLCKACNTGMHQFGES